MPAAHHGLLLTEVEFDRGCNKFSDDTLAAFAVARMRSPYPFQLLTVQFERAA
jgi:hypothetical protein